MSISFVIQKEYTWRQNKNGPQQATNENECMAHIEMKSWYYFIVLFYEQRKIDLSLLDKFHHGVRMLNILYGHIVVSHSTLSNYFSWSNIRVNKYFIISLSPFLWQLDSFLFDQYWHFNCNVNKTLNEGTSIIIVINMFDWWST